MGEDKGDGVRVTVDGGRATAGEVGLAMGLSVGAGEPVKVATGADEHAAPIATAHARTTK